MCTKFGNKFVVALENFQLYTPSVPTSSSTTGSPLDPYQGCQRKSRLPRPAKSRPCPASTLLYSTLLYCGPSTSLYYISLYLGWEILDDQHRNTNMNDKDHLVGQLTNNVEAVGDNFES